MEFSTKQLERAAVDVGNIQNAMQKVAQLSNIGDIGIAVDFSNNQLKNPLQNDFPLVSWLLNTAVAQQIRTSMYKGLAQPHKDADGVWQIMLPFTVGTNAPIDTTGECCWAPFDITKCSGTAPINMLCLKDCESLLDNLINNQRTASGYDLIGYFQREGESVKDARTRMAKLSMAFFTAYTIILGMTDVETNILKPFHGLLEVMEDDDVVTFDGSSILEGFDRLYCRLQVLGVTGSVLAVHPLTYQGLDAAVQPGRFGTLPYGWTRNGTSLSFRNMVIIQDKALPVDLTGGTGEAWLLNTNSTGAYLGTRLYIDNPDFIRHDFGTNTNRNDGCATECDYYYNYGTVFATNKNQLARIINIPLSANCIGGALDGLDGLVTPQTLVPMV